MIVRKTKRVVYALVVFSLFLLIFPASSMSSETAPQEVVQAAMDGLGSFLKAIPTSDLRHYGFSDKEDLNQATLGKPFRVYTITPDKVLSYTPQMELFSIVSPTNLWFFPVLYRGEVRTILTVDKMKGKWKAVAIGSSGLARQLKKVEDKWPESEGYEHKFVRIYQARSDFVILSKEGTVEVTPLESARIALKIEKIREGVYGLYSPSDIIPKLIPIVRQNVRSGGTIER